ncbi:uncharacterized protein N7483_000548 [Penicillium malachiteum]|uniref:uncharacterized protein n=1 Tax=Penicillium malachiteum TaxID=1324776 RepID=UPI002548B9CC|nr:uncharacterized protein N7483_000548 [Penicillium malachiteum]KAJ5735423.1 hypothetical protein N7483_000548 [Penicillium malachiteum]
MPPERRRIILEKSSTVRRRYQRSDQRFRFTAEQLKRIEREEVLDKRAKDIREREKKRIANKKKKVEQETKAREEARKQGLPDPFAPKIPSSQPLLSKFLGFANRAPASEESPAKEPIAKKPSSTPSPEPPLTECDVHHDGDTEVDSASGDTEPDSDCFDDLDEELEKEIAALEDTGATEEPKPQTPEKPKQLHDSFRDDTADYLEDVFSRGCGDSFGELLGLGSKPR